MSRWARYPKRRSAGDNRPRFGDPQAWADQVLAANPALPRDPAYHRGLVCAYSLQRWPDSPGYFNNYTSDHEHELWRQAYDHAQTLLPHYGF